MTMLVQKQHQHRHDYFISIYIKIHIMLKLVSLAPKAKLLLPQLLQQAKVERRYKQS